MSTDNHTICATFDATNLASITNTTSVLDAALLYTKIGWPVFPCRPGGKEPCTNHGVADATTDEILVTKWFRSNRCNIAIATGIPGPDVVDVDIHETGNGWQTLRIIDNAGLVDGAYAMVHTPSGGAHLYFTGTRQRNSHLRNHHIDFRSTGGYVLAPPSVVNGKRYEVGNVTDNAGSCDWDAIKNLLSPARTATYSGAADSGRLAVWVAGLLPGERNCGTFWAMRRAVESGGTDLEPIIRAAITTGLDEHSVRATAASALRGAL